MALVLNATPGDPAANSYCTVAEADSYHEGHLYASTWTAALTATKEAALVMATRLLDERYEWAAFPATTTQALQWPRDGSVLDVLQLSYIPSTVVPQKLKEATAELARQLIANDSTANSQVETQGLTELTVGSITLRFKDSVLAKVIPDAVKNMIPRWWGKMRAANSMMRQLERW